MKKTIRRYSKDKLLVTGTFHLIGIPAGRTIEGRSGRDEVLDKALAYVRAGVT